MLNEVKHPVELGAHQGFFARRWRTQNDSCSRVIAAVTASVALSFLALSCSETQVETSDVVSSIPWGDHEEARYSLVDREGEGQGTGVLRIDREGDRFRLSQSYANDSNSDETEVLVEGDTLKPVSLQRQISRDGELEEVEAEYSSDEVRIRSGDRQSFLRLAEHFYDNDTSLFVWRTIAFEEGLVLHYNAILTNRRESTAVTLRVVGREQVEVPAGSFQAWRLEIRSGSIRQIAWYADNERRHLVRYDNSEQVFLLEEMPEE
jgi:hypothetical protein